jgi:uncharacterized membrane protein YphA (DoxX/SURF4 family)
MFPQGGPGIGLLLLRIAVAAMFAFNITHCSSISSRVLYWVVTSLMALISLGLLLGFLTTIFSIVSCILTVACLFWTEQPMNVVYMLSILTSASLFFLGPGAYSVDARMFGLQVTVVPPRKIKK